MNSTDESSSESDTSSSSSSDSQLSDISASDESASDKGFANLSQNDHFSSKDDSTRPGAYVRLPRPIRKKSARLRSEPTTDISPESQSDRIEKSRNKKRRSRHDKPNKKDALSGAQVKPFPEGLDPSARRNEWLFWREQFMLLLKLKRSIRSQEDKKAFLIVSGGREIQKALKDKPAPEEDLTSKAVFDNAIFRLDHHFRTGTNAITDIIRFRTITQKGGEQFIDYVNRLKQNAAHCDFGDAEENEIMIQIRQTAIHAKKLGEMMTRESKTLAEVINYGSSLDNEEFFTVTNSKKSEPEASPAGEEVAFVRKQQSAFRKAGSDRPLSYQMNRRAEPYQRPTRGGFRPQSRSGNNRGGNNSFRSGQNRTTESHQTCFNCGRRGHFARDCRMQNRQNVAYATEDRDNKVSIWNE